ncbi:MAG: type II toxin-antitoxin system PemK/MazF family toxin [Acidobacteriaceae bacterium]|nr:type II toxin-antitoxin system PemK/MazF family toxin [Acidobacteriaceae bacterium]
MTTQNRLSSFEVAIPKLGFLECESGANVQGIGSIPAIRLERKLGKLPPDVLAGIKRALVFVLDLGV